MVGASEFGVPMFCATPALLKVLLIMSRRNARSSPPMNGVPERNARL